MNLEESLLENSNNIQDKDLPLSSKKVEPSFIDQNSNSDLKLDDTSVNSEEEEFSEEDKNIDEDFNQESEEELLDIPTFLRRQAN